MSSFKDDGLLGLAQSGCPATQPRVGWTTRRPIYIFKIAPLSQGWGFVAACVGSIDSDSTCLILLNRVNSRTAGRGGGQGCEGRVVLPAGTSGLETAF